jgi:hypothetical protein
MDRRLFDRVAFTPPLKGRISIITINGKAIESNNRTVEVHNVGMGGLCFSTNLAFPIDDGNTFTLKIDMFPLGTVTGHLVWKQKRDAGYYYGVKTITCNLKFLQTFSLLDTTNLYTGNTPDI